MTRTSALTTAPAFPLPTELHAEIAEQPILQTKGAAAQMHPPLDEKSVARQAARQWARIPQLNRFFKAASEDALSRHPEVAAASVANRFHQISRQDLATFQDRAADLVARNRHISVNCGALTQEQMSSLMHELEKASHLQNLGLKYEMTPDEKGPIFSDPAVLQASLKSIAERNPNLKCISLEFRDMDEMLSLPGLVPVIAATPKLTHLSLHSVRNLDGDWHGLLQPHLTHVSFSDCGLNDEDAQQIGGQLATSAVTHLDVSHSDIGNEGVLAIAQGLKQSKVTDLNLQSVGFRGEIGLRHIVNVLPDTTVRNLSLRGSGDAFSLLNMPPMVSQELAIALANSQMQEQGAKLSRLDLSKNPLGDPVATAFAKAVGSPSCELTGLNLGDTKMTHSGAKDIASAIQSGSKLKQLDLSNNLELGDTVALAFAEVLRSPSSGLTHLNLSNTGMTDAGAQKLLAALKKPHCKITHLSLKGNQISPDLMREINAQLGIDEQKMREVLGPDLMASEAESWF